MLAEIDLLITVSSHNKEHAARVGDGGLAADPKAREALRQSIEGAEAVLKMTDNLLGLMPSAHLKAAADRLRYWLGRDEQRWDDLFGRSCALRDAIRIEFKDYLFYAYPKEKGQKLRAWEADWAKTLAAFPEVRMDSLAAVDCYALQHYTASVFHSMRVAEQGLRALGKERRVTLPKGKLVEWATWQEIIRALDDQIRLIAATKAAGKSKDDALSFYSGARADLNGFKDEYRNTVMHVRGLYDEPQALQALTRVHEFMERLAGKLDHTHRRIRWGRS